MDSDFGRVASQPGFRPTDHAPLGHGASRFNPSRFVIPPVEDPKEPQPRMHKRPCKNCPSAHYPDDPESADIKTWPPALRVRTIFACGWSPVRYCRGYCDEMGVNAADVRMVHNERYPAQGMSTRSAKTEGLGPKDASPVTEGHAPVPSRPSNREGE
jgi:hypothetical protein